ncbi:MAG: FHA domain-containing protein [Fuerstiella sp.]|nr:FHA domain-containing protein [Fuerstiella sp.]
MVAVLQPLKNNKPIPIDRAVILVGRSEDCDVVINGSRKISRKHCCLVQFDDSFLIRDLDSTNGVWVNGKRVDRESEMVDGDRVAIGDVQFRFYPKGPKQCDTRVATQEQRSSASDGSEQPGDDIVILNPVEPKVTDEGDEIIELTDDDLVDDVMPDHRIESHTDDDSADDSQIFLNTAGQDTGHAKPEGRSSPGEEESDPVINLDDSFSDEEIEDEDIVIFDDE